jgi:TPR repeat protein
LYLSSANFNDTNYETWLKIVIFIFIVGMTLFIFTVIKIGKRKFISSEDNEHKLASMEEIMNGALVGSIYDQYLLGINYLSGIRIEKDIDLAIKWLTVSAEQGYVDSLLELCKMCDEEIMDLDREQKFFYACWIVSLENAKKHHSFYTNMIGGIYNYWFYFNYKEKKDEYIKEQFYWYYISKFLGEDFADERIEEIKKETGHTPTAIDIQSYQDSFISNAYMEKARTLINQ